MYVRKKLHGLMAAVLALMMCVAMLPTAAFAAETDTTDSSKTLTVGSSGDYTVIQEAINYIYGLTDEDGAEDGWTINVEAGTYARFVVQPGVDNLTIIGAGDATVIKTLCDDGITVGKTDACGIYKANKVSSDTQGIIVDYAGGFTLKNVKITMGTNSTSWKSSAIALANGDTTMEADNGFTLDSCSIEGAGASEYSTGGMGVFVDNKCDVFTIKNCTFTGCLQAIYYENTHSGPESVTIANNTFMDCSFAFHGSWSSAPVSGSTGSFTMSGNTVTGSESLRNKIVIQDTNDLNAVKVTISGNTLNYGLIGTINLQAEDEINDVLGSNKFGTSSFYVDAVEPGSIDVTYASYQAPNDNSAGYWAVTGIDDLEVDWGKNPEGTLEAVQAAIDAANASGSRVLNITGLDSTGDGDIDTLIKTFTWFKDAIYWVSGTMPSEKVDLPGLDKVIVTADGDVEKDDVAAGDTVNYKLTSNVPSNLDDYIDYSAAEGSDNTNVIPLGEVGTDEDGETYTYTLTFHDKMDSALSYNSDAKVTLVTYELDEDGNVTSTVKDTVNVTSYATITTDPTDDCTFEVSIDLLALYAKGIITESDFGSAEVIVTFSATLSKDATAGSYKNTAWVVYPNGNSEKDTVEVDTYKLSVFKYDQSTAVTDGEGNTSYTGLAGATFTVYSDADCATVITTITTNGDGYAYLDGLDAGTYYLKETEAPDGYVKADTVLTVTIPTDVTDYVASVSFANAAIPSTGGAGTTMYTVAGICIIMAAGLALVVTRKKREA